jgi:hypothetical protein
MNRLAVTAAVLACSGCAVSSGSNRSEELRQEFQSREERLTADMVAARADKAAGRTGGVTAAATITYWLGLKAALRPLPIDPGVAAREIDRLPTLGVDPVLVRESQFVVEKMRTASASIRSLSGFAVLFHFPRSQFAEAEALSRDAVSQCRVVERMRPKLTARYGMEFPPLDLPIPAQ